ncbi:hypothetical protein K2173_020643 [Erythroxylum novogranatense]|uniref:Transmembrane 9 superfamily member n=1 Tax=Erythroxylum novogranatense TaxID=1862640 RepID=A0AAV8TPD5_9ROSI|nr:hypothetical protein K2173_020643 [Erythroxylum novogranatense]
MSRHFPVLFAVILFSVRSSKALPSGHGYSVGDGVPLFVNKVGPLHNPSETYPYCDLPFCCPDHIISKKETLGEVLNGDRLMGTLYDLKFRKDKAWEILCVKKLRGDDVAKFRVAVLNDYYFQMHYDDLPFWGFIGKIEDLSWMGSEKNFKYYLFTHVHFDVLYNGNSIIEINALGDPNHAVDISEDDDMDVKFTYSVLWNATSTARSRMDRYLKTAFHPLHQKIHWFSFVNSIVITVLLMVFFVVIFMRHLKNDLGRYSNGDEEDKDIGWKYIHGDVFIYPPKMSLFSAVMGTGAQLLTCVCLLFVLTLVGVLYPFNRGALCTSLVLLYSITSAVGGYTAASFHSYFVKTGWERSVLLTGILFLGPVFVVISILNIVSASYGLTAALPFGTILLILLLYTLLYIPLLALGGVIGYHFRHEFQAPSTAKRYLREISLLRWYSKTPCQMFLGGLLPFGATVLELHQLYSSLWGQRLYTLPIILFGTFIILVLITAILGVGMTCIQLSMENQKWWWSSVLRGAAPSIFMFVYGFIFFTRSSMSGVLQLSIFIAYNACMCYAFFLMLGTISFCASFVFVRHIHQAIKSE